MSEKPNKTCSQCGTNFHCGYEAGEKTCWCFYLPVVKIDDNVAGCLCPTCLQARVQQQAVINPAQVMPDADSL